MKKQLANIITAFRVLLAGFLMLFRSITTGFYVIYIICGVSDVIDGPVARATGSTSATGAKLDTAGDILLYIAMFKVVLRQNLIPIWLLLSFVFTLLIQLASAIIAAVKYGAFFFVHSYSSKALGFAVYLVPISYSLQFGNIHMLCLCVISFWSGIENVVIQSNNTFLDPDIASARAMKRKGITDKDS